MGRNDTDAPLAPECVHDEMEAYYAAAAASPVEECFAPGMDDLQPPPLEEETPWRRRAGWIADLARRRTSRRDASAEAPAQAPPVEPATDDLPESAEDLPLVGLRVLVVHPRLGTRKQVASILGQMGFEVATCGQAEQAVLQVLHEKPDAVLTEIDADAFDALGLCRSLQERVPEIPVVIVAPGDDEAHYSVAMESGAADYLRRPVTPAAVADRLREAVRRARARGAQGLAGGPALDRQMRRQELKIQALYELSKNVVGCVELDELYQGFLLNAMGQLAIGSGVLFHLDVAGFGRPLEVVTRGFSRREARRLLDFRSGLGAYLLQAPQPLLLDESLFPSELASEVRVLREAGFGVACPMAAKGMPVGVALFGTKLSGLPFAADDLVMLTAVCNFAGPALEGARLYRELHRTYLSTVRAFVSSLEAKDTYTRGHSERVADYARVLGESIGLGKHDVDMLVFGGVLHDIGKIGVAEGILNKPGPLTPEEWRVVRSHPEMGARIVSNIDYLEPAVGHILHHHERIDGRGYPHGLVGADIELGARIVTVVDSFDAMTTTRPYREAMDVEKAIQLLRANAGRQFDPQIVEKFIDLLEGGIIQFKP